MEEAFALHKQVVQPGRWLVEVMPFRAYDVYLYPLLILFRV